MASINRGDNTGAFGNDFLRIYLNNPNELYIKKAIFQINGNLEKEFQEPVFPLRVNFTGAETELLSQVNTCKLALWDEYGRRRTADGKFTFFVKENRINSPDDPTYEPNDVEANETAVYFDLEDAEFAAEFVINATPSKMSELIQDIYLMTPDKIIGGTNIRTKVDELGNVIISAELDAKQSYLALEDKPSINGQTLIGNIEIHLEEEIPQSDWNETDPTSKAFILNKPTLSTVAITGKYADLLEKPTIPTKLSELENDSEFITEDVSYLTNYYTRAEVDVLVSHEIDLRPVYEKIDQVKQELQTEIDDRVDFTTFNDRVVNLQAADTAITNSLNTQVARLDTDIVALQAADVTITQALNDAVTTLNASIALKANQTQVDAIVAQLNDYVTEEDFNTALALKLNKTELGNGKLTINGNNGVTGVFYANQSVDTEINLLIPVKVSDLQQDIAYLTSADLTNYVTLATLNQRLAEKLDASQLGTGILTLKQNGNSIGTFNANNAANKEISFVTATKLSDLDQDIAYLVESDLDTIKANIITLQSDTSTLFTRMNAAEASIGGKLDISTTKSLVDNSEITRLSTVHNYDDTAITNRVTTLETQVSTFDTRINNKVDQVTGKGLSTNDFTDAEKNNLLTAYTQSTVNTTNIANLTTRVDSLDTDVDALEVATNNLNTLLAAESSTRLSKDNDLQAQIDALEAKSKVVDIVADIEELNNYDTSKLDLNDVICVLKDENHYNAVSYYRWNMSAFTYIGSEGAYYTRAESDARFAQTATKINGHLLNADINLTYTDVGALPSTTVIGDGTLAFKVNGTELPETQRFTANQVGNTVVELSIPTKLTDLDNTDPNYFVRKDVLVQTFLGLPQIARGDDEDTLLWDKAYKLQDQIESNSQRISVLEGELPVVAITGNYYDLLNLPTTISSNYKNIAKDPSYTDYIDNTFVAELKAKTGFITEDQISSEYALKTDIPTMVSQLENDRGYITSASIGAANITIKLAGTTVDSFNVNARSDKSIDIPVDDTLDNTSTNPIQNKAVADAFASQQLKIIAGNNITIEADERTINAKDYQRVSTFVGVTGNDMTLYYLDTAVVIGSVSYEVGNYIWSATEGFKLVANVGGSSTSAMFVGTISPGGTLPTTRPDGSALVIGDYVTPDSTTYPFTVAGLTFTSPRDTGVYMTSGNWQVNVSPYQKTSDTPIVSKATESIDGTSSSAAYQKAINEENAVAINSLVLDGSLTKPMPGKISLSLVDRAGGVVATDVVSDVVFTDDTQTLKNKSIDADNNTIINLEVENLKTGVLDTTELTNTDDTHIPSSKLVDTLTKNAGKTIETDATLKKLNMKNGVGNVVSSVTSADLSDIMKDDAVILTNKSIDAETNTISNLQVSNLKPGVLDTLTLTTTDDSHVASSRLIYEIIEDSKRGFKFTGYVSPTMPTGTIKKDELWYNSSDTEMPTTFPISVRRYDGTVWITTTEEYTPSSLELWSNKNNDKGYYWFGNAWNRIDFNVGVDNITVEFNAANQIQVKDDGLTKAKLNSTLFSDVLDDTSTDDTIATSKTIYDNIKDLGALIDVDTANKNLDLTDKNNYILSSVASTEISEITKDDTVELTNKTIDAVNNTISNISTDNFATGIIDTTELTDDDLHLASSKLIKDKLVCKIDHYETLPAADVDYEGDVVQYIGTTTADYVNGYFYKCQEVTPSTTPATYEWKNIAVQASVQGVLKVLDKTETRAQWIAEIEDNVDIIAGTGYISDYRMDEKCSLTITRTGTNNYYLEATYSDNTYYCSYDGSSWSDWRNIPSAIIEVTDLPTTEIDDTKIYKKKSADSEHIGVMPLSSKGFTGTETYYKLKNTVSRRLDGLEIVDTDLHITMPYTQALLNTTDDLEVTTDPSEADFIHYADRGGTSISSKYIPFLTRWDKTTLSKIEDGDLYYAPGPLVKSTSYTEGSNVLTVEYYTGVIHTYNLADLNNYTTYMVKGMFTDVLIPTTTKKDACVKTNTSWQGSSIYDINPLVTYHFSKGESSLFYYNSDSWKEILAGTVAVDDTTIHYNSSSALEIKDSAISPEKMETQTAADEGKTYVIQSDGTWDLGKAGNDVDNVTIEINSSEQLQVKDGGLSRDKVDANFWTDVAFTGTATMENLTVSDDLIVDDLQVNTLCRVPEPVNDDEAATKNYVDTTTKVLAKSLTVDATNNKMELKDTEDNVLSTVTSTEISNITKEDTVEYKNKTIDADNNTISNLELDNLKTGVLDTATLSITDDTHIASSKLVDTSISNAKTTFGYISTTEPSTTSLRKDDLWYNNDSTGMPSSFPIIVSKFNGSGWDLTNYTPKGQDTWVNKNNNGIYVWEA